MEWSDFTEWTTDNTTKFMVVTTLALAFHAWIRSKEAHSGYLELKSMILFLTRKSERLEGEIKDLRSAQTALVGSDTPVVSSEVSESRERAHNDGGPYRIAEEGPEFKEVAPNSNRKPFVSGQVVDVSFMDDGFDHGEKGKGDCYWFSATFVRFSLIEGQTHVWLQIGDGEAAPFALNVTYIEHPEVA